MITFLKLGEFGRLGNQLFQVAATIGVAARRSDRAVFPEWPLGMWMNLETQPADELHTRGWTTIRPSLFGYDPGVAVSNPGENLNLEGFFQSEKYFDNCREEVRAAIMSPAMRKIAKRVAAEHQLTEFNEVCAVHVRRGDYVKFSDLYAQLSAGDYYLPAMERMRREHGTKKFLIVSDDTGWCKNEFRGSGITFGKVTGGLWDRIGNSQKHYEVARAISQSWTLRLDAYRDIRVLKDLLLMSSCRHHIIANSSFSWWSSWLSPFSDRVVIAPRNWFMPAMGHDAKDLYRAEMIVI